jgi:quercetin dioxygenase-like cupin family protein
MYLTSDGSLDEYEEYNEEGSKKVYRKRLINQDNSSKRFALRTYIIKPGGNTSFDIHEHEHGVYIMDGEVTVIVNGTELHLVTGDIIHIASNEPHQFRNESLANAKFLCVRDYPIS